MKSSSRCCCIDPLAAPGKRSAKASPDVLQLVDSGKFRAKLQQKDRSGIDMSAPRSRTVPSAGRVLELRGFPAKTAWHIPNDRSQDVRTSRCGFDTRSLQLQSCCWSLSAAPARKTMHGARNTICGVAVKETAVSSVGSNAWRRSAASAATASRRYVSAGLRQCSAQDAPPHGLVLPHPPSRIAVLARRSLMQRIFSIMQRIFSMAIFALLATVAVAPAQTCPQPESATGAKTNQEQGESKAIHQGMDVDRGPGLPGNDTSETEQLRRSSAGNLSLSEAQRDKIKGYFSRSSIPREESVNFSLSVGASVPRQAPTHDFPQDLEETLPAYRGTLYVRARDQLVIIDRDTRRIVAIIPGVE